MVPKQNKGRSNRSSNALICSHVVSGSLLGGQLRGHSLSHKRFDLVADLNVIEISDSNAAFHAAGDLPYIVLEELLAAAGEADVRIAAQDAVSDPAAGDRAHLRNTEDVEHLRFAEVVLLE